MEKWLETRKKTKKRDGAMTAPSMMQGTVRNADGIIPSRMLLLRRNCTAR